ncbi:hypothetical protein RN86_10080 [Streptococcus gordonii]|nr:hypothetical protein RN86_10080 [Streptococcus gordonii]
MNRMQNFGYFPSFTNVKTFIKEYEKLTNSEPEIPVVPQFVADWIEYCKRHNFTLFGCLDPENGFESLVNESFEGDVRKCIRWCRRESNIFARAWLYGYTVEKEKRYRVRVKNVLAGQGTLNRNKKSKEFIFSDPEENSLYDTKFTSEELKKTDFGWVFDCEGIEIEEVE